MKCISFYKLPIPIQAYGTKHSSISTPSLISASFFTGGGGLLICYVALFSHDRRDLYSWRCEVARQPRPQHWTR